MHDGREVANYFLDYSVTALQEINYQMFNISVRFGPF